MNTPSYTGALRDKSRKHDDRQYIEILKIDAAYLIGVEDQGMVQYMTGDNDDLRLALMLSGGNSFLLGCSDRFYIDDEGYVVIERMV